MSTESMMNAPIPQDAEERLPWHKPEVRHIVISLSTQDSTTDVSVEDAIIDKTPR